MNYWNHMVRLQMLRIERILSKPKVIINMSMWFIKSLGIGDRNHSAHIRGPAQHISS